MKLPMQNKQQYPKPFAIYDELQTLAVIRGPEINGLNYFTTTAKSGRDNNSFVSADIDAFTYAGFNLGLSTGADERLILSNRSLLREKLPNQAVWVSQVHGSEVFDADTWEVGDKLSLADALITTQKNRPLIIQTADCMPIVLLSADASVLGVVHAGWRSLLLGIVESTIDKMQQKHEVAINHVWIGPSITASAFEVGVEVRDAFIESNPEYALFFTPKKEVCDKFFANLVGIANHKLYSLMSSQKVAQDCGIYFSGLCSYTLSDWFYSYRRNTKTGRFATVAYLC